MATKRNSKRNVSGSKGLAGGYAFWAPLGTQAPTDYTTALPAAFENMGYFSEDGASFSDSLEFEEIADANGDNVDRSKSGASATVKLTLIEVMETSQKVLHGAANVSDADGVLTVHHKGDEGDHGVMVLEILLKDGRRMRRVVHDAQRTELGDQTVFSSSAFAREATFAIYKDEATGDFYTDYIQSTETEEGGA